MNEDLIQPSPEINKKKTSAEMRAERIPEKVRNNFTRVEDINEAERIALKINSLIDQLPEEKQGDFTPRLLQVLNTAKDIYYYKELHDEILEFKKKLEQPNVLEKNNDAEPDNNLAIFNQTLYVNGEIKNIQTQYFNDPDKVKINFGNGWKIVDKKTLVDMQESSKRIVALQEEIKVKSVGEVQEEMPLTEEEMLKEFLYTKDMTAQELKDWLAKSPNERKVFRDSLILESSE